MDALRVRDAVIPRCLDWHAGEDDTEDRCEPENDNHDSNRIEAVSQGTIWEDPSVGGDDREFG